MVKFFVVLICVLTLQLSKVSCQETNWILYSGDEHSDHFYFNTRNIVRGENTVLVWIKRIFNKSRLANPNRLTYDMIKIKMVLNFKSNKYKFLALYEFLDEKEVSSSNCENISTWDDIVPDGLMEEELLAVKKYLHIDD